MPATDLVRRSKQGVCKAKHRSVKAGTLGLLQGKEKEALDKSERLAEEGDVDGSMLFANQV